MAVLLWQTLAVFSAVNVEQRAQELSHLIVHSQDINHHHHADNALHMDNDGDTVQHLHADSGANTAGLLSSLHPILVDVRPMPPPEKSHCAWLSPTLEGPLRPPMQYA
jgi:hypothetical protein